MEKALIDEWFSQITRGNVAAVKQKVVQCSGSKTIEGDTGLLVATKNASEALVAVLAPYESGHRDTSGMTALGIGITMGSLDICKLLAPYEVYVPIYMSDEEKLPLILALEIGCLDVVGLLLEHVDLGDDSSVHNRYLNAAVTSNKLDVVKYVLKHCAITLDGIETAESLASGVIKDYLHKIASILRLSTCPMCGHVNLENFSTLSLQLLSAHAVCNAKTPNELSMELLEKDKIILSQKLEIERLRQKIAELHISFDADTEVIQIDGKDSENKRIKSAEYLCTESTHTAHNKDDNEEGNKGIDGNISNRDSGSITSKEEKEEKEEVSCLSESSQLKDLSTMNHLDNQDNTISLDKLEEEQMNQEIHISILGSRPEETQPKGNEQEAGNDQAQVSIPRSLSLPNLLQNKVDRKGTNDDCEDGVHMKDFVSQQLHRYRTIRIERVGNTDIDMRLVREMQERPFNMQSVVASQNKHSEEFSTTSSALDLPSTATSSTTSLLNGGATVVQSGTDNIDKYVYVRLRFDAYDDCLYGTIAEHILPVTFYQTSEYGDGTPRESVSAGAPITPATPGLNRRCSYYDDGSDRTPLMHAAAAGDLDLCRDLLFDYVGKRTNTGKTALMFAVEGNHIEIVRLLLEKEAGKVANSKNQIIPVTALQIAALRGYKQIVELLLKAEAGIQDKYGFTALMYAAANDNVECIRLLLPQERGMLTTTKFITGQGISALVVATANNNLDAVKILLPIEEHIPRVRSKAIAYGANNECTKYIKMVEEQRMAKLRLHPV